jgi:hypothetical protein
MRLGSESAAGTAECVVGGFVVDATGWFLLQVTVAAGAGGVLVRAAGSGVDTDVPVDPAGRVRAGLRGGKDGVPGAVTLPAAEQPVDGLLGRVLGGDVTPGEPTRMRQQIPLMSCRLSHFGGPPRTGCAGNSGASAAHCASVRSCRLVIDRVATRSPV